MIYKNPPSDATLNGPFVSVYTRSNAFVHLLFEDFGTLLAVMLDRAHASQKPEVFASRLLPK